METKDYVANVEMVIKLNVDGRDVVAEHYVGQVSRLKPGRVWDEVMGAALGACSAGKLLQIHRALQEAGSDVAVDDVRIAQVVAWLVEAAPAGNSQTFNFYFYRYAETLVGILDVLCIPVTQDVVCLNMAGFHALCDAYLSELLAQGDAGWPAASATMVLSDADTAFARKTGVPFSLLQKWRFLQSQNICSDLFESVSSFIKNDVQFMVKIGLWTSALVTGLLTGD